MERSGLKNQMSMRGVVSRLDRLRGSVSRALSQRLQNEEQGLQKQV